MLDIQLRYSRIEFCFRLGCHLAALFALTLSDLVFVVTASFGIAILLSLISLLSEPGRGRRRRIYSIALSGRHSELRYGASILEVDQPWLSFFSEFLMVLNFRPVPATGRGQQRPIRVVIWPDTLTEVEDRRLRRYLRFDCQGSTHADNAH